MVSIIRRCPQCKKKNRLRGDKNSNKCGNCGYLFYQGELSDDVFICPCCGYIPRSQVKYVEDKELDMKGVKGVLGGAMSGAMTGIKAGSFVPGVGNVLGGVGGAVLGGLMGGDKAGGSMTRSLGHRYLCSHCNSDLK